MTIEEIFVKRTRQKISQRSVADAMRISPATLVDIERGRVPVAESYLALLDEAIDGLVAQRAKKEGVLA